MSRLLTARDISAIPDYTLIETRVRGLKITLPRLGGVGAMLVEGTPWTRRIDEVEAVTVLVNANDTNALRLPEIDDRILAALPMLADGATSEEIADRFQMSLASVSHQLGKALDAWGCRNRTQFVAKAYQRGVLEVASRV